MCGDLLSRLAHQSNDFFRLFGAATSVESDRASASELLRVGIGRIGKTALLANFLEESGRHSATYCRGEDAHRKSAFIGAGKSRESIKNMSLFGLTIDDSYFAQTRHFHGCCGTGIAGLGRNIEEVIARKRCFDQLNNVLMLHISRNRDHKVFWSVVLLVIIKE